MTMHERMTDRENLGGGAAPSHRVPDLFESLVERHAGEVQSYLLRLCGNRHDAEELAQDVFVKAFRKLDTLREIGAARRWLFTIAVNHFNDWISSRAAHRTKGFEDDDEGVADPGPDPRDVLAADELRAVLADGAAELPERQRTVLFLFCARGFDYSDIGEALGISADAVKMSLFHAREKLRRRIRGHLRNG